MAEQKIKLVIQLRRDYAANWEKYKDIVPAQGEPCFVVDKNILKIGDGVTKFCDLEPINGAQIEVHGDNKSIVLEDGVFKLMGYDAAEVGAQLQKTDDGIKWVVPIDLTGAVEALQADVDDIEKDVAALQEDSATILSKIGSLENKMDGTGEGTVDAKIDAKINEFAASISDDGKINTIKELIDYVAGHGPEVAQFAADIKTLQELVGGSSVTDQINAADLITRSEAEDLLISKVDASATLQHVKYELDNTPAGTIIDYGEKEIRVMVPAGAEYSKQNVGTGGDQNTYYITFKTYAPSDDAVGYIEHLGNQSDAEILNSFSVDKYGRRYQPTWLGVAKYNEATGEWNYYGKNSTANKYIGWDYRIDWYDVNGVMIGSDCIRINLSNEDCHHIVEPYYMAQTINGAKIGDTLLEIVDRKLIIPAGAGLKSSEEVIVNEDGSLSLGVVDVSRLAGDLVFDGGGAAGQND